MTDSMLDGNAAELAGALTQLLDDARRVVADVDDDVHAALADADQNPVDADDARELLQRVIAALKRSSDPAAESTAAGLERDFEECVAVIVNGSRPEVHEDREGNRAASAAGVRNTDAPETRDLELQSRNDIEPGPVYPTPVFDQQEIPMRGGFVRVTDLLLRGDTRRVVIGALGGRPLLLQGDAASMDGAADALRALDPVQRHMQLVVLRRAFARAAA